MKEIDVNKIIKDISLEIQEKGFVQDLLSFKDSCLADGIDPEELLSLIYYTKDNAQIQEYPEWDTSSFLNKIKVIIKKSIRKLVKFYVVPITEKQNKYNNMVSDVMIDSCKILLKREKEIGTMKQQIADLEKKYAALMASIKQDKE